MKFTYNKGKDFYENNGNMNINNNCNGHINGNGNTNSIWDIIHSSFGDYSHFNYSKNWYLLVFIMPIMLKFSNVSHNFIYEFIVKFMIIILLRSFTIVSTILPKNSKLKVDIKKEDNFFKLMYHRTIGGGGYDKTFSGHLSFGLLLTLLLFKYKFLESNNLNTMLYTLFNIIHFMIIGITRSHYTVDMIIAIYVTLWVYNFNLVYPIMQK